MLIIKLASINRDGSLKRSVSFIFKGRPLKRPISAN
jgi:hypothetical protein